MVSRRLYEIVGLACGFVLIDYGFSTIAVGLQGARQLTSQFIGINMILGGSAVVFGALYYLFKPVMPQVPSESKVVTSMPDIGVELITDDKDTAPKYGFYKNIEYIGYFFTLLGLVSAADLVLQVFIPILYNEVRFWVEILLVVFGVLSYAIFFSLGRLGAQEEQIIQPTTQPALQTAAIQQVPPAGEPLVPKPYSDVLEVHMSEFSKSEAGEYERHLSDKVYDMVRVEGQGVTAWRENRMGLRSVYLAGPYELNWKLLEDYHSRGEELRIGALVLPLEAVRALLGFRVSSAAGVQSPGTS